ncbi:MAG: glycerol-3-phosphate 1-O-acyltransferase PlsY [Candidatus Pelagibacter sp.]
MDLILITSISYLMGSIPFGLILSKIFLKKDIRNIGSGNIGATNVLRSGNKTIGYLTLVLDILKAIVPVLYIKYHFPELIYISSLSVFLGHVFPIWLKFKGGKGVATYIGILFSINYILGITFTFTWLLIFFISRYSSLGSILSTMVIPIFVFFNPNYENEYFYIILFVLIFFTHRENVKRLINKEESKTKIY